MTTRPTDGQLSIGTLDTSVTFADDHLNAAPPAQPGDDIMRLRALLRPIISDLLREELRTTMRMRG